MLNLRTGKNDLAPVALTRRDFGKGLAAILAAGCAPAIASAAARGAGGNARMGGMRGAAAAAYQHSAREYVQDGLIAMWDGIENAGWGTHDTSATTWKDLIGNDNGTGYNVTWEKNCAVFDGTSTRFDLASQLPFLSASLHAEVVIALATPYQASTVFNAGEDMPCLTISTGASKIVTYSATPGSGTENSNMWPIDLTKHYFSVHYSSLQSDFAYENAIGISYDGSGAVGNNDSVARIGCRNQSGYSQYMKGRIYHIRLYNTLLTQPQIAANYRIDKARFGLT